VRPLEAASNAPLDEAGAGWSWSLEILPGPYPELQEVIVRVDYVGPQDHVTASCELNRYLRDPATLNAPTATEPLAVTR
jgi:hypothetical protein